MSIEVQAPSPEATADVKAGCVWLPFWVLEELLQLPEGARIRAATVPIDVLEEVCLQIEGAGYVVRPGWRLPELRAFMTTYRDDDGKTFKTVIDWKLPA